MSNKQQRRITVINPRLQWYLALRNLICMSLFLSVTLCLGLIGQYLRNPDATASENVSAFFSLQLPTILAMICLAPVFIRDSLQTSLRFAGPMFRLARTCQQHANGEKDVPRLQFRQEDLWHEVADSFNDMVDELRRQPSSETKPQTDNDAEVASLVKDADPENADLEDARYEIVQ